jgi:hypothetical protein
MSGKSGSVSRQATKAARRIQRRKGRKPKWIRDDVAAGAEKLISRSGNGGTDKSGSKKKSIVYYSDKPASR